MATFVFPASSIDTTGLATEAKQDAIITEIQSSNTKLDDVNSELDTQTTRLTSIDSKDFATQTTLQALLTELEAKADLTETQPVSAASLPLPTGAATESTLNNVDTKLQNLDSRLAGALAPVEHDELEITYVPSGNGVGEVQTVVYKLASATVATLTLSYDASNRLTGVVKS